MIPWLRDSWAQADAGNAIEERWIGCHDPSPLVQGPGQVRGKRPEFSEKRSGSGTHTYATTRSARILTNGIVNTEADKYRQTSVRDGTVGAGRRRHD